MNSVKTICAYCHKLIKDGPLIDGRASHGCCPECAEKELKKLQKVR